MKDASKDLQKISAGCDISTCTQNIEIDECLAEFVAEK